MKDNQSSLKFIPAVLGIGALVAIGFGLMLLSKNMAVTDINEPATEKTSITQNGTTKLTASVTPEQGGKYNIDQIPLTIITPRDNTKSTASQIMIKGQTVARAEVFINELSLTADNFGNFSLNYKLDEGDNYINIIVNDIDGNYSEKELLVIYEPQST